MQATFKQTAIKAAKAAGKIQLAYFGKAIKKIKKKDNSFVTKADIESTKKIREMIGKQFPSHSILCEELGCTDKKSDYKWIIDPLDGTHNFMVGNPLFGISIALEYKKEIILGVIYLPIVDKMYYAEKGKGAFCNGNKINVSNKDKIEECILVYDSRISKRTNEKIKILAKLGRKTDYARMYGAAIYGLSTVAEGNAEIKIDFDSNPWDHSAGLLIVEEAGGKVSGLNGEKWNPYIKDYLATNGKVHAKVLNVIKK